MDVSKIYSWHSWRKLSVGLLHNEYISTMPNSSSGQISCGSRVSAKIGPFQERREPQQQRKSRATRVVFHGTVIGSSAQNERHFRVYWDECNKSSEHTSRHLQLIDNPEVDEEQRSYFKSLFDNDEIYIGLHKDMMSYTKTIASVRHPPAVPTTAPSASSRSVGLAATHISTESVTHQDRDQDAQGDDAPPSPANSVPLMPVDPPLPFIDAPRISESNSNGDPDQDIEEDMIDIVQVEAKMRGDENNNSNSRRQATYLREKGELINDAHRVIVKGPHSHETVWTVTGNIQEKDVHPHVNNRCF